MDTVPTGGNSSKAVVMVNLFETKPATIKFYDFQAILNEQGAKQLRIRMRIKNNH